MTPHSVVSMCRWNYTLYIEFQRVHQPCWINADADCGWNISFDDILIFQLMIFSLLWNMCYCRLNDRYLWSSWLCITLAYVGQILYKIPKAIPIYKICFTLLHETIYRIMHELPWITPLGSWMRRFTNNVTHEIIGKSHHELPKKLFDLASWRYHIWSVTSHEHGLLALWRHIRRLFWHTQIGTKAILTSE